MKKIGIFLIIVGILMASFASVQPVAAANTGVMGQIVDGKTAQGWAYGAEILIIQISGATPGLKGSTYLAADGTFSVNYPTASNTGMTDDLGLCASMGNCLPVDNFSSLQVLIGFTCDFNTVNGTRPNETTSNDGNCPADQDLNANPVPLVGLPGNFEVSYTDTFSSVMRDLGDIDTNRGPTAITLKAISAENTTGISPLMISAFALIVVGLALIIVYRRRQNVI